MSVIYIHKICVLKGACAVCVHWVWNLRISALYICIHTILSQLLSHIRNRVSCYDRLRENENNTYAA